jgi:MtN3 and saliva related transmembrane protein
MATDLSPEVIEVIGFLAGTLTTLSFVPQVAKALRSRSTGDLSTVMLTAFTAGVALWLLYGVALRSWPVILANAITLVLAGVLLRLKLMEHE